MAHRKSLTRAAKQRRIAHFLAQPLQAPTPGHSATLTGVQKADLEARTVGRVVFPWDADYDADRQETNPAFQCYPLVIVYCACETDVLVSMEWPRRRAWRYQYAQAGTARQGIR
jgi:hypothetical protein